MCPSYQDAIKDYDCDDDSSDGRPAATQHTHIVSAHFYFYFIFCTPSNIIECLGDTQSSFLPFKELPFHERETTAYRHSSVTSFAEKLQTPNCLGIHFLLRLSIVDDLLPVHCRMHTGRHDSFLLFFLFPFLSFSLISSSWKLSHGPPRTFAFALFSSFALQLVTSQARREWEVSSSPPPLLSILFIPPPAAAAAEIIHTHTTTFFFLFKRTKGRKGGQHKWDMHVPYSRRPIH